MTENSDHISAPQSSRDTQNDEFNDLFGQLKQRKRKRRAARRKRRKKAADRRIPVFQEEVGWGSGMRVYSENSFDRLRMPRSPHWSVVWSDLMMTMFILFAVMFIYQSSSKGIVIWQKPGFDVHSGDGPGLSGTAVDSLLGPEGKPDDTSLAKIYDLSRQTLSEEKLQEFAKIDLAPDKTVRIILTGDLLFDSGRADFRGTAQQSLRKFIPLIKRTPYMINVVGHTDDVPIQTRAFPSNWELSLVRASHVARFLMQESGLPQGRFYVTGHSSFQPVAPNDTEENRAKNRRVEIILTREKPAVPVIGEINEI